MIAITEKPYFDDNWAIHTFSMRDDENCEELKVKFKGIEEKEQAIAEGFQQGREQGKLSTMINLVNKGVITKGYAWEELGVSEQEFEKYL